MGNMYFTRHQATWVTLLFSSDYFPQSLLIMPFHFFCRGLRILFEPAERSGSNRFWLRGNQRRRKQKMERRWEMPRCPVSVGVLQKGPIFRCVKLTRKHLSGSQRTTYSSFWVGF